MSTSPCVDQDTIEAHALARLSDFIDANQLNDPVVVAYIMTGWAAILRTMNMDSHINNTPN